MSHKIFVNILLGNNQAAELIMYIATNL